jgi:hypothetical protein
MNANQNTRRTFGRRVWVNRDGKPEIAERFPGRNDSSEEARLRGLRSWVRADISITEGRFAIWSSQHGWQEASPRQVQQWIAQQSFTEVCLALLELLTTAPTTEDLPLRGQDDYPVLLGGRPPEQPIWVGYFHYATNDLDGDDPERMLQCAREYVLLPDGGAMIVCIDDPNYYSHPDRDPGGLRVELEVFPSGGWEIAPQGGSFGARGGTHIRKKVSSDDGR